MTCPLCEEPKIDVYNLMKKYCSNVEQIKKDICEIHKQPLVELTLGYQKELQERLKQG